MQNVWQLKLNCPNYVKSYDLDSLTHFKLYNLNCKMIIVQLFCDNF